MTRAAILTARGVCTALLAVACTVPLPAQTVASRFTTGGRDLVLLTFGATAAGALPPNVTIQSGSARPVTMLGQRMLQIVERTVLLVQLPEVLPQDFTIEVDIVPKTCCQPEDLALEGTAVINQGAASANVLWHHNALSVIGGQADNNYHGSMPAPPAPGTLVTIELRVQGDNMTLFTNGQQSFALTNRKFARTSYLRVFLGGQNDTDRAVYLARLRVIANSAPVGPITGGTSRPVTGVATTAAAAPIAVSPPGTLPPASTGVVTVPAGSNPAGAANAALFAPPAQRTIGLSVITAAGTRVPSRVISVTATAAKGVATPVASRTVRLNPISSAGSAVVAASRTVALTPFTAAGKATVSTSSVAASRTIRGAGYSATGTGGSPALRNIAIPLIAAAGSATPAAARTITLAPVNATGLAAFLSPHSIRLAGWTFAGTAKP